jgi:hypothetical protein
VETIETAGSVRFTSDFGALKKKGNEKIIRKKNGHKIQLLIHTSLARPSLQSFSLM